MENPLSQSELETLARAPLPARSEAPSQSHDMAVRLYDFRRPTKFGKDLLRTLVMIHDSFNRLLQSFFLARVGGRVQISTRGTHQYSFAEYTQSLPNPAIVGTLSFDPLPGICLLEISHNIAFAIVDKLFGGPGSEAQPQRGLTEIELSVTQKMLAEMCGPLQEAWRSVADVNPRLEHVETNPLFLQTSAPSEVLAVVSIGVQIGEHVGNLTLAYPFSTVDPVLSRLAAHSWLATNREGENSDQMQMRESLEEAPLEVTVHLGQSRMTMGEFASLQIGDLILLDRPADSELPVYVGNSLAFLGRPGSVRGRLAVQIKRAVTNPAAHLQR